MCTTDSDMSRILSGSALDDNDIGNVRKVIAAEVIRQG